MLSASRLPLRFDVEALERETDGLAPDLWVPHFNQAQYEGDWSGVALRSVGGVQKQLYPDPTAQDDFAATPVLRESAVFSSALDAFRCRLLSARLLRLGPGARISEHRDYRLGYDDGEVRIHVPISTHPGVEFLHEGRRIDMQPGEAWYLDLNLPHAVTNDGDAARVHLVVDCVVDEWVTAQLEAGEPYASAGRSSST